jgi:hypothetical protein
VSAEREQAVNVWAFFSEKGGIPEALHRWANGKGFFERVP